LGKGARKAVFGFEHLPIGWVECSFRGKGRARRESDEEKADHDDEKGNWDGGKEAAKEERDH
jgi:hypothetical protein